MHRSRLVRSRRADPDARSPLSLTLARERWGWGRQRRRGPLEVRGPTRAPSGVLGLFAFSRPLR